MAKVCISDVVGTLEAAPAHAGGYHSDDFWEERRGRRDPFLDDLYLGYGLDREERLRRLDEQVKADRARRRGARRRKGHVATPIYKQLTEAIEELGKEQQELNLTGDKTLVLRDRLAEAMARTGEKLIADLWSLQFSFSVSGEEPMQTRTRPFVMFRGDPEGTPALRGGSGLLSAGKQLYQIVQNLDSTRREISKFKREIEEKAAARKKEQLRNANMHQRPNPVKSTLTNGGPDEYEPIQLSDILLLGLVGAAVIFFLILLVIAATQ